MITQFFLPKLDSFEVANMWFQLDGPTCHTAIEQIQLLDETFPCHVRSIFGDQNWPPRSFLWGYLKSKVYGNKLTTTRALQKQPFFRSMAIPLSSRF